MTVSLCNVLTVFLYVDCRGRCKLHLASFFARVNYVVYSLVNVLSIIYILGMLSESPSFNFLVQKLTREQNCIGLDTQNCDRLIDENLFQGSFIFFTVLK